MTELNQEQSESPVAEAGRSGLPIGERLRQAREERGETIGQVASALKLTLRQVNAMETNRFDLLPGAAFARGFLRNYARHLDIDLDAAIGALHFDGEDAPNKLAPIANAAGVMPNSEVSQRTFALMKFFVAALVLIVLLGWYFDWFKIAETPSSADELPPAAAQSPAIRQSSQPLPSAPAAASEPIAPPPVAEAVMTVENAPAPSESPAAAETPSDGATAPPASPTEPAAETVAADTPPTENVADSNASQLGQLVFTLHNSSWIQVRDRDGVTLFSGTDPRGATRKVQGTPPFSLVVGNAPEVTLEFNGQPVDMTSHTNSGVARLTVE